MLYSGGVRGYLLVRDNFFHPSLGQLGNLGEGVEAWRGFHSSIRMTKAGLTLNLGTSLQSQYWVGSKMQCFFCAVQVLCCIKVSCLL